MSNIAPIQAPPGFYSASASTVWGASPLQPPVARSVIASELQAACKEYIHLFPPPPGSSWGSFWGNFAIAAVCIFAVGACAVAIAGSAAGAGAAASAGSAASAGTATTATAATSTAATGASVTAGTAGVAAGSTGAAGSMTLSSAMGALQSGAGYVAAGAGIVAKATGNKTAAKLSQAASVIKNSKTLPQTASNLASALMPGDYLSPADQKMQAQIAQYHASSYGTYLERLANQLNTKGSAVAPPYSASTSGGATHWMIYAIPVVVGMKVVGII